MPYEYFSVTSFNPWTLTSPNPTNIINSVEIYGVSSTAHPGSGGTANTNLRQHIIDHFLSERKIDGPTTTYSIIDVAVEDPQTWNENNPFWINYNRTTNSTYLPNGAAVYNLLGSATGKSGFFGEGGTATKPATWITL